MLKQSLSTGLRLWLNSDAAPRLEELRPECGNYSGGLRASAAFRAYPKFSISTGSISSAGWNPNTRE